MSPVIRWAVTGPTGAGKSRFCAHLAARGAVVVDADRVGHAVLDEPPVGAAVVAAFGRDILGADGRIDRNRLGPRIFADPAARARLDALVHPALAAALVARIGAAAGAGPPLVILEAAVYFLLPGPPPVDMTVTVTAPEPARLARLIAKGLSPDSARQRIAAQAHLEPYWSRAVRIIHNDGSEAALAQEADRLWREFVAPRTRKG
ncbi:MAG TPA: dephospho-CoA kinase [Candidatus Krumholzibacteria bacterium]|nr:dephospho-CoA kinase [Candidatus Krumholzibacteria bacterium]HPD71707.1 dephospho-CoA kinase [Candidatus Krumholzibacteria bacterium]HRY41360.1 dephospho-CoA kinase [Candidatus Krumholzibacteria bacterium]